MQNKKYNKMNRQAEKKRKEQGQEHYGGLKDNLAEDQFLWAGIHTEWIGKRQVWLVDGMWISVQVK